MDMSSAEGLERRDRQAGSNGQANNESWDRTDDDGRQEQSESGSQSSIHSNDAVHEGASEDVHDDVHEGSNEDADENEQEQSDDDDAGRARMLQAWLSFHSQFDVDALVERVCGIATDELDESGNPIGDDRNSRERQVWGGGCSAPLPEPTPPGELFHLGCGWGHPTRARQPGYARHPLLALLAYRRGYGRLRHTSLLRTVRDAGACSLQQQTGNTASYHSSAVYNLTFTPSGDAVVATTEDSKVVFLDHRTCKQVAAGDAHGGGVTGARFIDQHSFCTGDESNRVLLWDRRNMRTFLRCVGEHESMVKNVEVYDRSTLISAGFDGTVRVWDLDPSTQGALGTWDMPDVGRIALSSAKNMLAVTTNVHCDLVPGTIFLMHNLSPRALSPDLNHRGDGQPSEFHARYVEEYQEQVHETEMLPSWFEHTIRRPINSILPLLEPPRYATALSLHFDSSGTRLLARQSHMPGEQLRLFDVAANVNCIEEVLDEESEVEAPIGLHRTGLLAEAELDANDTGLIKEVCFAFDNDAVVCSPVGSGVALYESPQATGTVRAASSVSPWQPFFVSYKHEAETTCARAHPHHPIIASGDIDGNCHFQQAVL